MIFFIPMYHHTNNSISNIGYLFMRGVTIIIIIIINICYEGYNVQQ